MSSGRRIRALTWARTIEFLRDRSTLGWNLLFPVLMVAGFAVVFSGPTPPMFKVAVLADTVPEAEAHPFLATPQVYFYAEPDQAAAVHGLERHRVDMVLQLEGDGAYWINQESPKGVVLEQLLAGAGGAALQARQVSGAQIRYVDWVAPGLLGMNMMFSCLFGIGYVVVRYRKSGYLKRLSATPLSALEFVSAQLLSRLSLVLLITIGMYAGMDWFLDFRMDGSYLLLTLTLIAGAVSMTSMGLIVAARVTSEEFAGGLLNVVSWPMMILSGVFYSLDGAPAAVQWAALLFPLTHLLEAARAIMLDGAGFMDVADHLLVMGGMSVVFLLLGAFAFRWTQD